MANIGRISQVIGPVVDVNFENATDGLPNILDALEVTKANGEKIILECLDVAVSDPACFDFLRKRLLPEGFEECGLGFRHGTLHRRIM